MNLWSRVFDLDLHSTRLNILLQKSIMKEYAIANFVYKQEFSITFPNGDVDVSEKRNKRLKCVGPNRTGSHSPSPLLSNARPYVCMYICCLYTYKLVGSSLWFVYHSRRRNGGLVSAISELIPVIWNVSSVAEC